MSRYTNKDRKRIIDISIRSYKETICMNYTKQKLLNIINEMENVRLMCLPWRVEGIVELESTLKDAYMRLRKLEGK